MGEVTAFRDRTFGQRYQQMGDQAEQVCAQVLEEMSVAFTRYGFQRPPFSIQNLPLLVRYSPDFVLADRFVECQGFGRDGKAKFKRDKLETLHAWAREMPVDLFLWWSARKKWAMVPLAMVTAAVDDPARCELGHFDGSKAFFSIHGDALTSDWRKLSELHAA